MADLSLIEAAQFDLDEDFSTFFIPDKFRFMQELWIQVRITERLRETGTIKLDSPIPRMWTGYYYLLADNCVFKSGPIEYQNQEIYRGINLSWNAEIAANENSYNLSTPEVPPDIDAVDETSEADLWASDDDENYYLIRQLPIDRVTFLVPRGCKLTINLCGIRFSPLSVFGPDNDINLYEDNDNDGVPDLLKKNPDNPFQFPEIDEGLLISDFDAIARNRGYILASECEVVSDGIYQAVWNVGSNSCGGQNGLRTAVFSAPVVSQLSQGPVIRASPVSQAPPGLWIFPAIGPAACQPQQIQSVTPSGSGVWYYASILGHPDSPIYVLLFGSPNSGCTASISPLGINQCA